MVENIWFGCILRLYEIIFLYNNKIMFPFPTRWPQIKMKIKKKKKYGLLVLINVNKINKTFKVFKTLLQSY